MLIPLAWLIGVVGAWALSTSEYVGSRIVVFPGGTDGADLLLFHADPVAIGLYGFIVGATAGVVHDLVKPTTPPHDGV